MSVITGSYVKEVLETTRMLHTHELVLDFALIGSALYHPEPKDLDFLVLVRGDSFFTGPPHPNKRAIDEQAPDLEFALLDDATSKAPRWAFGADWQLCGGEYDDQDDKWGAIRNGPVNLIVTVDPAWYARAQMANEVCHALRLMDKEDRIAVYHVIRDGYSADEANARRGHPR